MKTNIIFWVVLAIFLIPLIPYASRGKYFDDAGKPLGTCTTETVPTEDGWGAWTYDKFYDKRGDLIGSCSSYAGPGSSGWKGGCDDDAAKNGIGTKIEDDSIYAGRITQNYTCMAR